MATSVAAKPAAATINAAAAPSSIASPPKTPAVSPPPPTEIERALRRITGFKNVKGTIIADKDGNVLHSTFSDENLTTSYATHVLGLTTMARSSIRELDNQSELQMLRVRSVTDELVIIHEPQFTLIVVQGLKDPVEVKEEDEGGYVDNELLE